MFSNGARSDRRLFGQATFEPQDDGGHGRGERRRRVLMLAAEVGHNLGTTSSSNAHLHGAWTRTENPVSGPVTGPPAGPGAGPGEPNPIAIFSAQGPPMNWALAPELRGLVPGPSLGHRGILGYRLGYPHRASHGQAGQRRTSDTAHVASSHSRWPRSGGDAALLGCGLGRQRRALDGGNRA